MSKRTRLGFALLGLTFLGLLFAYFFVVAPEPNQHSPAASSAEQPAAAPPPERLRQGPAVETGTTAPVADLSETAPVDEARSAHSDSRLPEAELDRLSEVFLNTVYPLFQYDFQLDHEGRAALDAFVASLPEGLSRADLDTVAGMIENQLSSPGADDVAFIITHLYRLEQEEARLMQESGPVTTMAGQLEAQEQLAQLREQWFGAELSARLFSGTDEAEASADSSPAVSRADGDSTETPPEIQAETQAELADIERAWEQRYQSFLAEKQLIDRAGLDQVEKDQQIEALLQQHYTPQELEAARAFGQLQN